MHNDTTVDIIKGLVESIPVSDSTTTATEIWPINCCPKHDAEDALIRRAIKLHYKVLEREGCMAMHPSESCCQFDETTRLVFICNGSDILTVFRYYPERDRFRLVTKHNYTTGAYGRIVRGAA